MCCILEALAHIATILAGIGTIGTFWKLILDSKNKSKQLEAIQNVESRQLEVLYTPDIRIRSYGPMYDCGATIDLVNNGENLIIRAIIDSDPNVKVINAEGMRTWFPLHFDKGDFVKIPLAKPFNELPQSCQIKVVVTNKMQQQYSCTVIIKGNEVKAMTPIKETINR